MEKNTIEITKDELENIVTAAFLKEMQSPEFENDYTCQRRLQVIYAHFQIIKMIRQEKDNK